METNRTTRNQSNDYSRFQSQKPKLPDITYSLQYTNRLQKELEEARKDAEMWGIAFDKCYEDLCKLQEQIEVLKNENFQLFDEVNWLRAKLIEYEKNTEDYNEECSEVDGELDLLLLEKFKGK